MQFVDKFRHDESCTRGWTPISVMRSKIKIRTPSRHKAQLALHVLYDTKLVPSIRSGEYLSYSYIPHGVGAFGSHLTTSSRRERLVKRKPNTHTPPTTWDRYSPDSVSCRLGFSTIYTAMVATHISRPYKPKSRMGFAHAYARVMLEARRTAY
jgi:hypothetical protein